MCRQGANLLDFNYPSITVTRKLKNVGPPTTTTKPISYRLCLRRGQTAQVQQSWRGEDLSDDILPYAVTALGYVFGEVDIL